MGHINTVSGVLLTLLAVVWLGCSDNQAIKLRYQAEQDLFEAEKARASLQMQSNLSGSADTEDLIGTYGRLVDFFYAALDSVDRSTYPAEYAELQNLNFQASTRLLQLFIARKQFDTCISLMNRLVMNVEEQSSHLLATKLNLGRALQGSGNWDSALVVYDGAVQQFHPPLDASGNVIFKLLNLPLEIYNMFVLTGDSLEAAARYDRAEQYYLSLVDGHRSSMLGTASLSNLARLYSETGQWHMAIAALENITDSTGQTSFAASARIGDIYSMKLGDFSSALRIYQDLMEGTEADDKQLRPIMMLKISMVRLQQGKYTETRKLLSDMKRKFSAVYAAHPSAQYAMARSFELEGNWSRAESEYTYLTESYEGADEAMAALIHLGDTMAVMGRTADSERWYDEAERYFDRVKARWAGTQGEARALMFKAELYLHRQQWKNAAQSLEQIFSRFPNSGQGREAMIKAARLYADVLQNKPKADSLIERLKATLQLDGNQGNI